MSKIEKSPLVILAGGNATRMEPMSRIFPKSSLPIFDQPLLIPQISLATESGIENIIVSVNSSSYTITKHIIEEFGLSKKTKIKIYRNKAHRHGSLNALLRVMNKFPLERIIMSFGDIYFVKNPFDKIQRLLQSHKADKTYIFGHKPETKDELLLGGIIESKNGYLNSISLKPAVIKYSGLRWNGLVLLSKNQHVGPLERFLNFVPNDTPEEEYFEYYNNNHEKIRVKESTNFINVNEPEDLLLANVIQFSKTQGSKKVNNLTKILHKYIMTKQIRRKQK